MQANPKVPSMPLFEVMSFVEEKFPAKEGTTYDAWFEYLYSQSFHVGYSDGTFRSHVPCQLVEEGLDPWQYRNVQCHIVTTIPAEVWRSIEEDLFGPDNGDTDEDHTKDWSDKDIEYNFLKW